MNPDHEELLAKVLAGEIGADDPRVAALPPEAKEQLAKLGRLQRVLDAAAATERATLDDLAAAPPAAERAGPPMPPPAAHDPAARKFWLRGAGIAALAAGALLLVQTFAPDGGGNAGNGGAHGTLGRVEPVELIAPRDAIDGDFALFLWQPRDAAPLDRYVLSIWDAAAFAADGGTAPLVTRELAATSWRVDTATPALPDRITWRVDVQPLEGVVRRGPTATAWRRR